MAHEFNSDDYKFNSDTETRGDNSDVSELARAAAARAAKGKVRTFKDDMLYAAENARRQAENTPTPADVATIKSMAANNASSRMVTGGRQYTPKSSFMDKAGKAAGAVGSAYDNTKELAGRAAGGLKKSASSAVSGLDFSKDDKPIDEAMDEGLNKVKENAQSISGDALFVGQKVVSATASAVGSAIRKGREGKQARTQAKIDKLRKQAAAQAQLNSGKNDRFNDRSNRFSDSASKFNKASRFDDKSGRFNEVFEKDDFKAKPEKADIAKAVTVKDIESFITDKDNAKSDSKALTAEQRKNKYADRFIDPEQPKGQTQIAIAGSKTVATERQKAKLEPVKKKFAVKNGKNARLNVAGNAGKNGGNGKDLPKKKDKGLLKKVAKMRVIKAISSGELTINSDGSLENGIRRISGNGVAGKVGSAVKRIGDAIKATMKALIKVISFIIRHPIITLFIIIIILLVVVVLIVCDAITTHWGGAQAEQEKNTALIATVTTPFSKNTSYKGDDIVQYALQFVGNAYCIGGDNINGHIPGEDGIDCSHFVYRVLQETGHYDGGYVTSKLWANLGEKVSLNDLQPGDVASFDGEPYGHVVIIVENLGGGKCEIVHAKGKNYGIVDEVVEDITLIHGRGNLLGFSRFTKQNTYT